MLKILHKEISRLRMYKEELTKIINEAPDGRIKCVQNKNTVQFYLDGFYLPKKYKEKAIGIANGDYARSLNKKIDEYMSVLEELRKLYANEELEAEYRRLGAGRKKIVKPLIIPVEEIIEQFESITYKGKEFDEKGNKTFFTMKGERVRSKSEKIIADELYRYGIPYKYEMPLELMGWNKAITIYPDFTIINRRTGKRWILEHLGMMDDANYYENSIYKIDLYEKNGLLLGKDLLVFHESAGTPLNTRVMSQYIEEYFI